MMNYPTLQYPSYTTGTFTTKAYLDDHSLIEIEKRVRTVVAEELAKMSGPSMAAELIHDGKRYRGTFYLVEDESEE